jgi:uncharacterized protein DUF4328
LSFLGEGFSLVFPPLSDDQELGENMMGAAVSIFIFLLALLEFFIYLATVVFFLMWLYRSHNNLRAFNPSSHLDYSAGWAVGSLFIPFVDAIDKRQEETSGKGRLPKFPAPPPPPAYPPLSDVVTPAS